LVINCGAENASERIGRAVASRNRRVKKKQAAWARRLPKQWDLSDECFA
jgi:hypothetical protein